MNRFKSYICTRCSFIIFVQMFSITTAKHRTRHLCWHTSTPPGSTWTAGGASTFDQLHNVGGDSRQPCGNV